jgi:hypothetical protein
LLWEHNTCLFTFYFCQIITIHSFIVFYFRDEWIWEHNTCFLRSIFKQAWNYL